MIVAFGSTAPACADTLQEALASSFRTNSALIGQRRVVSSSEAAVAIASAAGRPQIVTTIGAERRLTRSGLFALNDSGNALSGGIDLALPLFNGHRVHNSVEAEQSRLRADLATLKAVEGDVFTEVATAYMDVLRDHAIVKLYENQVRVLGENLRATQATFDSGDLTRTDIAQSQARLSLAAAQLSRATAQLTRTAENYWRVIGLPPRDLEFPPPLAELPASADSAVKEALSNNPDLIASAYKARAAEFDVKVARASRLPKLEGSMTGDYVRRLGSSGSLAGLEPNRSGLQSSVGLDLRIPFYQGGRPSSQIRRAQALQGETLEQRVELERAVIANTRSQFAAYEAGARAVLSSKVAVAANKLALEGARIERRLGTRTVLDELNAEQELLNSQVELISARRDVYVAGFQLLNTMGRANAGDLKLELTVRGAVLRDAVSDRNDWSEQLALKQSETPTAAKASPGFGRFDVSQMVTKELQPKTESEPALVSMFAKVRPAKQQSERAASRIEQNGTWQIQLGAFRVRGSAQSLYKQLSMHLPTKLPVYSSVGAFTRLRVGPYQSKSQALTACRMVVTRGHPCIVISG
ncbi:TolC family outer membrane protein [Sphingomonas piscis]|uniref:TolC family outer membrane protein n=1 Tax=Sphingomonas piscis TaxID=2714943 RepID=A0A6G7YQW9_9SPHN|nr:TolC family outer membrane protein [Sphingomonas piscis]QIK79132.1 TolC family outer membrane protein [Sphingomonas piscis]